MPRHICSQLTNQVQYLRILCVLYYLVHIKFTFLIWTICITWTVVNIIVPNAMSHLGDGESVTNQPSYPGLPMQKYLIHLKQHLHPQETFDGLDAQAICPDRMRIMLLEVYFQSETVICSTIFLQTCSTLTNCTLAVLRYIFQMNFIRTFHKEYSVANQPNRMNKFRKYMKNELLQQGSNLRPYG